MPKVLRIINRFNLGGITYNVSFLSRFLSARYQTLLIGGPEEKGEQSSIYIPKGLGLEPVIIAEMQRSVNPLSDFFAYRRIKKIIREYRPDIVHTHASKAGAVGRLAAAHCGVPVIVHTFHGNVFQGYFSGFKTAVIKAVERYLARKSTAIVAISAIQKEELTHVHQICAPDKVTVIPLGFDLQRFSENQEEKRRHFRATYGLKDDEIAIGIIGRLAPIKNHPLFFESIAYLLKHTNRKIKALIIGDGDIKPQLTADLQRLGLSYQDGKGEGTVIFTSWITEVDVALAGLDLVALSSRNEGTPVSLIEAQAAGRYIVSTDVGGVRDILHPDCGLLCASDDLEAYRANLLYAVQHFDALSAGAGAAKASITEKFSYHRLCADMERLYDRLLSEL